MDKTTKQVVQESLSNAMTYADYRTMVAQLVEEEKSSGPEQTEDVINFTQLNHKRMKRWDKTLKFSSESLDKIGAFNKSVTWLVLSESWCGDAAIALPVMNKIAELNPNISFLVLLRDENSELMDRFLTNGTKSIPKLIVFDDTTKSVVAEWGSRSKNATDMVEAYKKEHGGLTPEFKQDLQMWYNKDKGQSILEDLLTGLLLK